MGGLVSPSTVGRADGAAVGAKVGGVYEGLAVVAGKPVGRGTLPKSGVIITYPSPLAVYVPYATEEQTPLSQKLDPPAPALLEPAPPP